MLRIKQNTNQSVSENKKKLSDELNAVGVAQLELAEIEKEMEEKKNQLEIITKGIEENEKIWILGGEQVSQLKEEIHELRRKRKNANSKNDVSQKNLVAFESDISNSRIELTELQTEIKEHKRMILVVAKEVEKAKLKKSELSKKSKELLQTNQYVELQIQQNKIQKKQQLSQIESEDKYIMTLQEATIEKIKASEEEIKGKKGELVFLREELKHTDKQNKEKKTEMWRMDVHMEEEQKKLDEKEKEFAQRISTFENAKQELKKKWLVLQKGEEIEEVKEFFKE